MKFALPLFGVSPRYYAIEVGGTSPAALRRAGRLGDGWIEIGSSSLGELERKLAVVTKARHEAGRDELSFEVTAGLGDLDSMRQGRDIGVTRVLSGPWANPARLTRDDVLEWIKRFADEVIAKAS